MSALQLTADTIWMHTCCAHACDIFDVTSRTGEAGNANQTTGTSFTVH